MLIVLVDVEVKAGSSEAFLSASMDNAAESLKEPGIARFDVIRNKENPCHFLLIEVYRNDQAPAEHKNTKHYALWRDLVEDMMARPRRSMKYVNCFPLDADW